MIWLTNLLHKTITAFTGTEALLAIVLRDIFNRRAQMI